MNRGNTSLKKKPRPASFIRAYGFALVVDVGVIKQLKCGFNRHFQTYSAFLI
jgi:hypothetical protein